MANTKLGRTDGSEVPAGHIGEYVQASLSQSDAVPITNLQQIDLCSFLLSPGDWQVEGSVDDKPSNKIDGGVGWVNDVSQTISDGTMGGLMYQAGANNNMTNAMTTGLRRWNIAAPTTIYLGCSVYLSVGTCVAYGFMRARRMT